MRVNDIIDAVKKCYCEVVDSKGKGNLKQNDALLVCGIMCALFWVIMAINSFKVTVFNVYIVLVLIAFFIVIGSYFRYNNGSESDKMICTKTILLISLALFSLLCIPYILIEWLYNRFMRKINLKMYSHDLMLMMLSLGVVVFYIQLVIVAYMQYTHHNMFGFVIFCFLSYVIVVKWGWSIFVRCMYRGKRNAYRRYIIHAEKSNINAFLIAVFTFISVIIAHVNDTSMNNILSAVVVISAVETLIKQAKYFDNNSNVKKCLVTIVNDLEMCREYLSMKNINTPVMIRFKFDLNYLNMHKDDCKNVKKAVEKIDSMQLMPRNNDGVVEPKQYCIISEIIKYDTTENNGICYCTVNELCDNIMEVMNYMVLAL